MNRNILIIGATSAMAEQAARLFAADGDTLLLAARDPEALADIAADLRLRGAADVHTLPPFDALRPTTHSALLQAASETVPRLDIVLIAHGVLPDQARCERNTDELLRSLEINLLSPLRLCNALAGTLLAQRTGTLAVISSVAGLRGRQSNYIYGTAKGGLHLYLQGLRNRLHPHGIRVVTFLPGFIDTPMTAALTKGPLFCPAETAGRLIHKHLTQTRADIAYIPGFWRPILWILRALPESLFKRLSL